MIISTSAAVTAVVSTIIAHQMARALLARRADLCDDEAVARCLCREGFGSRSISALMGRAGKIARRMGPKN